MYVVKAQLNFEFKYKKDLSGFKSNDPEKSNFVKHSIENGYYPTFDSKINILYYYDNSYKFNFLEALQNKKYYKTDQHTLIHQVEWNLAVHTLIGEQLNTLEFLHYITCLLNIITLMVERWTTPQRLAVHHRIAYI